MSLRIRIHYAHVSRFARDPDCVGALRSQHPVLVVGRSRRLRLVGVRVHSECFLRYGVHAGACVTHQAPGGLQGKPLALKRLARLALLAVRGSEH